MSDIRVTAIKLYGVTGENLNIQRRHCVFFVLRGKTFRHTFLVCPLSTNLDGLLGSDFLRKVGADISFGSRKLSLGGSKKAPHERVTGSSKHAVLTIFPKKNWKLISLYRHEGRERTLVGINWTNSHGAVSRG
jgi:hypothetical protein